MTIEIIDSICYKRLINIILVYIMHIVHDSDSWTTLDEMEIII